MMNLFVERLNLVADRWAGWVASATLDSAALLAICGLVWWAARRRAVPQVGYCLFLLVPLKLLIPVEMPAAAAIARWTPSAVLSSWLERARPVESAADRLDVAQEPVAAVVEQAPVAEPNRVLANPDAMATDLQTANSPIEPAAATAALSANSTLQPTATAMVMAIWLIGVVMLLARLLLAQWRFGARLRAVPHFDDSRLAVDFDKLRRQAGVTQSVRIVDSDELASPAVYGIMRPIIILPQAILAVLTAQQLRWVLLHELAHIRRRDLLVVTLQRLAAIVHFFNPVVWIANHITHRLREYACDDVALALCDGSAVESGEAFLQILRHSRRSRHGLDGALSVFGLDSRADCIVRVHRLLDSKGPVRTQPGAWSICGLVLLAALSLPYWQAANAADDDPQTAAVEAGPVEAVAEGELTFELHVVGPDGKPIPGATVELRTNPMPTAEQIRQGKFLEAGPYGPKVSTDGQGVLSLTLPRTPMLFDVDITTAGYGPYWGAWSQETHPEPIPGRFTAQLDAGWPIGGIVVDDAGTPVADVEVEPSIRFKKRAGDLKELYVGTDIKTDASGQWRFDSVPNSLGEVSVEINHPGFMPIRRTLTRSEFEIRAGQQPDGKITLDRGLTVVGRVTDEAGNPIAGALVRTKFLNDVRRANTNSNGFYKLIGCEARTAHIVVSAPGRAINMQELRIASGMEPVNFQMQPGGKVRIKVLDEHEQPVPRARIFFQRWRGFQTYFDFAEVNQYAGADGIWEWTEAPLDEFKADICQLDGMSLNDQSLIAREEEYVFRLPGALVITGKVVDAETKEPVKSFEVVPGTQSADGRMSWARQEKFAATDGQYSLRETYDRFAYVVRIEADGYQAAESRDVKSNAGRVSVDFELRRGRDVAATVLTPDGQPAAGAQIALGIDGSQISVTNGEIDGRSTYATLGETDEAGRLTFPPQSGPFQLVILHPSGYVHLKATPQAPITQEIALEPWARVEGTFQIGKELTANIPLSIHTGAMHSYGNGVPSIFLNNDTTSGKDGSSAFERVPAGRTGIGRRLMLTVEDGAADVTSARTEIIELTGGQTTKIALGGTGRPVIGKLQPPENFKDRIGWNFAMINVDPYIQPPPDPRSLVPIDIRENQEKADAWMREWMKTPAGRGWQAEQNAYNAKGRDGLHYWVTVDKDGSFHIDDVPQGEYTLTVRFDRNAQLQLADYRFSVPDMPQQQSDEVLDLGILQLQ